MGKNTAKNTAMWLGSILLLLVIVGVVGMFAGVVKLPQNAANQPTQNGQTVVLGQNPAYTYQANDAYSSTVVGGTDQIKANGNMPVTSLAAPDAGLPLQYWKNNGTYFCEVASTTALQGSHSLQTNCYANATITLGVYDKVGRVALTSGGGANNITMGANGNANLEISYQATAKASSMPFGGCMAIDVPTTITSNTVEGSGISTLKPCPYKWTYATLATTNAASFYEVPAGFDKNGLGDYKTIALILNAGGSDPAANAKVTFQPANYYVASYDIAPNVYHPQGIKKGDFVLGIEKDANADTTKTVAAGASFTFTIQ